MEILIFDHLVHEVIYLLHYVCLISPSTDNFHVIACFIYALTHTKYFVYITHIKNVTYLVTIKYYNDLRSLT